jgi:hypothetical protein
MGIGGFCSGRFLHAHLDDGQLLVDRARGRTRGDAVWNRVLNFNVGGLAWGLGPPIGAVLMVIGGFIYGRKAKEVAQ